MEYDHESQVFNFIAGLALGAIIGAGIAILTAPAPGSKTRKKVRRAAHDLRRSAGDRIEELSDEVRGRVGGAVRTARKRLP